MNRSEERAKVRRLIAASLIGIGIGVITWLPVLYDVDVGEVLARVEMVVTAPRVLFALHLSSNIHNPSFAVIIVSNPVFYTVVIYNVLTRRARRKQNVNASID